MRTTRTFTLITALALLAPVALSLTSPGAFARGDPAYCANNPQDPRCEPGYCESGTNDPWCWDPRYCERAQDDPICQKEPPAFKHVCEWSMIASPPVAGASPGPATISLTCPGHILDTWSCGWKNGRSALPINDPSPSSPICTYTGKTNAPVGPCGTTHTWNVARPDLRTVTAWLRAEMWKDADCDGKPDDWNTGSPPQCKHPNVYSPKANTTFQPYQPLPDGKVNDCDKQIYEWQWRQFN